MKNWNFFIFYSPSYFFFQSWFRIKKKEFWNKQWIFWKIATKESRIYSSDVFFCHFFDEVCCFFFAALTFAAFHDILLKFTILLRSLTWISVLPWSFDKIFFFDLLIRIAVLHNPLMKFAFLCDPLAKILFLNSLITIFSPWFSDEIEDFSVHDWNWLS